MSSPPVEHVRMSLDPVNSTNGDLDLNRVLDGNANGDLDLLWVLGGINTRDFDLLWLPGGRERLKMKCL